MPGGVELHARSGELCSKFRGVDVVNVLYPVLNG